jgi:hypothetical protein
MERLSGNHPLLVPANQGGGGYLPGGSPLIAPTQMLVPDASCATAVWGACHVMTECQVAHQDPAHLPGDEVIEG